VSLLNIMLSPLEGPDALALLLLLLSSGKSKSYLIIRNCSRMISAVLTGSVRTK